MLALLALAVPAQAAPVASSSYVYEVVRTNAKAWPHAYVRIRPGRSVPFVYTLLAPGRDGGYEVHGLGAEARPTREVAMKVDLSGGKRFLVGSNGPASFHVNERYWSVRRVRLGFRWTLPDPAERRDTAGVTYEEFTRATLPSGPYGSVVLASVPCDDGAGVWSLRKDDEAAALLPTPCLGAPWAYDQTASGGSWVLEGHVLGHSGSWPYRLAVLDLPKPG